MRKFLETVGKALQIGVRNDKGEIIGQGAIVTFSEDSAESITLKESSEYPGKFTSVVRDDKEEGLPGPLPGGRTKTHLALIQAKDRIAIKEAGFREDDPDVEKLLVVITDGEQTKGGKGYQSVEDAIKPFFDRDMKVFAIGVGLTKQAAKDEINQMVEDKNNAIFPESYSKLIHNANKFVRRFCPGKLPVETRE